jgi:PTH1 family peptidyl-tRNA hydrolase
VLTDDLNLSLGSIRMKKHGSDGGHNGLKDICQVLETNHYPRLRIGIGNSFIKGKQIDYVLGDWTAGNEIIINQKLIKIKEMVLSFCFSGIENTMNTFNNT